MKLLTGRLEIEKVRTLLSCGNRYARILDVTGLGKERRKKKKRKEKRERKEKVGEKKVGYIYTSTPRLAAGRFGDSVGAAVNDQRLASHSFPIVLY